MALAHASTKRLSWGGRLESALYRWTRCFSFSRMVRVGLWFSSITTRPGNRSSDCASRIFRVRVFAPRIAGPTFLEISRSLGVGAHRDIFICLGGKQRYYLIIFPLLLIALIRGFLRMPAPWHRIAAALPALFLYITIPL